jgi:hypothetical protein
MTRRSNAYDWWRKCQLSDGCCRLFDELGNWVSRSVGR